MSYQVNNVFKDTKLFFKRFNELYFAYFRVYPKYFSIFIGEGVRLKKSTIPISL